ncbi:hypothetical protein HDU96_001957, partial [Phlyctochytrium bullatum]
MERIPNPEHDMKPAEAVVPWYACLLAETLSQPTTVSAAFAGRLALDVRRKAVVEPVPVVYRTETEPKARRETGAGGRPL